MDKSWWMVVGWSQLKYVVTHGSEDWMSRKEMNECGLGSEPDHSLLLVSDAGEKWCEEKRNL